VQKQLNGSRSSLGWRLKAHCNGGPGPHTMRGQVSMVEFRNNVQFVRNDFSLLIFSSILMHILPVTSYVVWHFDPCNAHSSALYIKDGVAACAHFVHFSNQIAFRKLLTRLLSACISIRHRQTWHPYTSRCDIILESYRQEIVLVTFLLYLL